MEESYNWKRSKVWIKKTYHVECPHCGVQRDITQMRRHEENWDIDLLIQCSNCDKDFIAFTR